MVPPLLLADAAEKAFPAIQRERGTANRRRTCCEWRQVQELPPSPWTSSGAHRFLCHRSCADEESDDLERKGFPGTFHHGSGNGISVDTSGRHRALLECRQLLPGRRTGSWPAVPVTNCRKSSARDSVCTEQRASVREWRTLRWYSPSTIHSKPDRPKSSRLLARSRCRVERAPFPSARARQFALGRPPGSRPSPVPDRRSRCLARTVARGSGRPGGERSQRSGHVRQARKSGPRSGDQDRMRLRNAVGFRIRQDGWTRPTDGADRGNPSATSTAARGSSWSGLNDCPAVQGIRWTIVVLVGTACAIARGAAFGAACAVRTLRCSQPQQARATTEALLRDARMAQRGAASPRTITPDECPHPATGAKPRRCGTRTAAAGGVQVPKTTPRREPRPSISPPAAGQRNAPQLSRLRESNPRPTHYECVALAD